MAAEKNEFGLSIKEQIFVDEYFVNGFRPGAAAVKAGYSPNFASVQGTKLLERPVVRTEVARRRAEIEEKYNVTQDKIIRELATLGFSNMADYMTVQEDGSAYLDLTALTREQASAIQQLDSEVYMERNGDDEPVAVKKTRIRLHDKRGPLELLGKHLGTFEADNRPREIKVVVMMDGNKVAAAVGVKD